MKSVLFERVRLGIDPIWLGLYYLFAKVVIGKTRANRLKVKLNIKVFKYRFFRSDHWDFNGALLPKINESLIYNLYWVYLDTLFVHCHHHDNYAAQLVDRLDEILPEGPYSYERDEFKVVVCPDDVVIDAGAWIGDFSAYASLKGGIVYAFEPSVENFLYLKQTAKMNPNIILNPKGLANNNGFLFIDNDSYDSVSFRLTEEQNGHERIEVITLDDFVLSQGIRRVDFIKADIEGAERKLLLGATNVLKNFAPKLSICTYHLPDDPEVLSSIILKANPLYTIVQKRHKLYAAVIKK